MSAPQLRRYAINSPRVIHESFEHEIVIVNLDSGKYYCLQDAGVVIWTAMTDGRTRDEAVAILQSRYAGDADTVIEAADRLIDELMCEQLLVERRDTMPVTPFDSPAPTGTAEFHAPVLQVYSDMQDLLLLDPIHEVDATGWPMPAPAASLDRTDPTT